MMLDVGVCDGDDGDDDDDDDDGGVDDDDDDDDNDDDDDDDDDDDVCKGVAQVPLLRVLIYTMKLTVMPTSLIVSRFKVKRLMANNFGPIERFGRNYIR